MGMTRADARSFLAATLAEALADAGLGTTDTAGALKEVIDSALLLIGTDHDDIATAEITGTDILGYRAVLEYVGWKRCAAALQPRTAIQLDGPQMAKQRQHAFDHAIVMSTEAKIAAAPYLSSGDFAVGTWNFDFLEPVEVA